ncbi:MAG TPA: hypothetical protein VIP70_09240 [Nitrososphaeraceae archaeon]
MIVSKEEIKINSVKNNNIHRYNSLFGCRINNHYLTAKRIKVDTFSDTMKSDITDQCIFLVKCNDCNLEWKELWRTSRWFITNNNYYNNNMKEAITIKMDL